MIRGILLLIVAGLILMLATGQLHSDPGITEQRPTGSLPARPYIPDVDHLTSPNFPPLLVSVEPDDDFPSGLPASIPIHQSDLIIGRLGGPATAERIALIADRLSGLQSPTPRRAVPPEPIYLPGSPRSYRNGIHQGVDIYDGVSYGDPVLAAGAGLVIRADHDYIEPNPSTRNQWLETPSGRDQTPPEILDRLHGRQLWLYHGNGVITRYSHLASVTKRAGDTVDAGDVIGTVGNSGTGAAAEGRDTGAHLHLEIHLDGRPFWDDLELDQIRELLSEVFSRH